MTTQMLKISKLALVLAIGMCGHTAAAMEEVVVYGTDISIPVAQASKAIKASMSEFTLAANDAQKTRLEAALVKFKEQKIQIAAARIPTRG